jgi:hypothetical protein
MGGLEAKAAALLTSGRVSLLVVGPGVVDAEVVGDSGVHEVSWRDFDSWWCGCPAFRFRRRCSHQSAVARVAVCLVRDQLANTMQQGPES